MWDKKEDSCERENTEKNIVEQFFLERIHKHIILTQRVSKPQRNDHKNRIHMKCYLTHHLRGKP